MRSDDMDVGQAFIDRSRAYLAGEYFPKIRRCLGETSEEDLWWRPNDASNSIGNLVLHLAGNVRQWVVSGIGGKSDQRKRDLEFSQDRGWSGQALAAHLESTLEEVEGVLSTLEPGRLQDPLVIQGMTVSVLDALYHVVEHFSTHTGQIIYLAKLKSGKDLGFWEVKDGRATPRW